MDKNQIKAFLLHARIVVVGLGKSGCAVAEFLKKQGGRIIAVDSFDTPAVRAQAEILLRKGIEVRVGPQSHTLIHAKDIVIISPGIKPSSAVAQHIVSAGSCVLSELDVGYLFCPAPIIAVTGSNGKSTVVTLITRILEQSLRRVWLVGNIGTPLAEMVEYMGTRDLVVCEVSSFQLVTSQYFRPECGVVLNLQDNHKDWHGSWKAYVDAKKKIVEYGGPSDRIVLNYDDPIVRDFQNASRAQCFFFSTQQKVQGAYRENNTIVLNENTKTGPRVICSVSEIPLQGVHNSANVAAAALVGSLYGIRDEKIREAVLSFQGLAHRIQKVGMLGNVCFINDSKSTTIGATEAALAACEKKVILIAGGRDKGADFVRLREVIQRKVKALVVIGEASDILCKIWGDLVPIDRAKDMTDAVEKAYHLANPDADVLLSPMCASFDMFHNFEHRGEVFTKAVERLCVKINQGAHA